MEHFHNYTYLFIANTCASLPWKLHDDRESFFTESSGPAEPCSSQMPSGCLLSGYVERQGVPNTGFVEPDVAYSSGLILWGSPAVHQPCRSSPPRGGLSARAPLLALLWGPLVWHQLLFSLHLVEQCQRGEERTRSPRKQILLSHLLLPSWVCDPKQAP